MQSSHFDTMLWTHAGWRRQKRFTIWRRPTIEETCYEFWLIWVKFQEKVYVPPLKKTTNLERAQNGWLWTKMADFLFDFGHGSRHFLVHLVSLDCQISWRSAKPNAARVENVIRMWDEKKGKLCRMKTSWWYHYNGDYFSFSFLIHEAFIF